MMDSELVDYDESNYPANAESESDSENPADKQQSEGVDNSPDRTETTEHPLSEDILCVVCAEILVEPCSLHCGHSFCQLCLAALWKSHRMRSPLHLHCPVCRQPWVNFPGINIQLRNIIEREHKALVDRRHTHFSATDKATLAQFRQAKDGEWQKERQQTRHGQQLRPAVLIAIFFAVFFCGLVLIAGSVLVAVSGGNGQLVQKPVVQWDNADVMDWLTGLGDWASDRNISRVFLKERINGAQLKLLNQSTLKDLGVNVGYFKTQSLLLAIEQLQQKEYVRPRNFNEFMAAHRKKTFLIGIMYKLWPRFTFFYVYLFEYYDVFHPLWDYSATTHRGDPENAADQKLELTGRQVVVFGVEILLVPHYVVGLFAWHWWNVHPWIATAIIVHCMWTTQSEAKKTLSCVFMVTRMNWKLQLSQMVRVFFRSLLIFFCALSGGLAMWPIVPYFLCDGIFYLVLWNTVYAHILFVPWRFIRTRMRRRRFLQQQNIIMP